MRRKLPVKNILVVRLTSIRDILIANPVASALKRQNPNACITWVVRPELSSLLKDHPDIDNLISFDLNRWQRLCRNIRPIQLAKMLMDIRSALSRLRIDSAIDLQGDLPTGIISRLSGAKHRIALGSSGGNSLFMTKTISRNIGEQTQIGSEYRYLVNQLGASDSPWDMYVPENPETDTKVASALKDSIGDSAYAVISPYSIHPQRKWFDDYWEQIVLRIRGRYHLRTIILGGDDASKTGKNIAKLTGAVDMTGKTDLIEAAAIIRKATLVIGVDNGLTHMGHALKIPCISLFGATFPYAFVDNESSRILYLDRFCSPCRDRPICNNKYECMREISPDKVLTAIKPLISGAAKKAVF